MERTLFTTVRSVGLTDRYPVSLSVGSRFTFLQGDFRKRHLELLHEGRLKVSLTVDFQFLYCSCCWKHYIRVSERSGRVRCINCGSDQVYSASGIGPGSSCGIEANPVSKSKSGYRVRPVNKTNEKREEKCDESKGERERKAEACPTV